MRVELNNLLQFLNTNQIVKIVNEKKEVIYSGEFHLLTNSSQWLDVKDLYVIELDPQEDKSLNIQLGNIPDREELIKETVFLDIDYKKIRVFCKVKFLALVQKKEYYRQVHKKILEINKDKFYKVESTNYIDEEVSIMVDYTKLDFRYDEKTKTSTWVKSSEERMILELDFDDVEFSFFFEDTKEDTLIEGRF